MSAEAIETLAARYGRRITRDEIVLYAGTNLVGARAAAMLASPLGMMPAMGRGPVRDQPGVGEIADIEALVEANLCRLFRAKWVELRLASCTLANIAVYQALCAPGDLIVATALRGGGHASHHAHGAPHLANLRVAELPYDEAAQAPDDAAGAETILALQPKLVVLGASFVPRLFAFDRISAASCAVGAPVLYDIAHIAGLVAGDAFPNPLDHGANLLTASTYKSLGGPPGGLVMGRDPALELQVRATAFPVMTANYDASRVAALGVSLAETPMSVYATAMLANARALEAALANHAVPFIPGHTHHIGLPRGDRREAAAAMAALETAGILCGICPMAANPATHGLRIGTQLITRRGFPPESMAALAALIARALEDKTQAAPLRQRVAELSHRYTRLQFCDDGMS